MSGVKGTLSSVWKPGVERAFAIDIQDIRFIEQYLRYEGRSASGQHLFRLFWKTYWERIGGGPSADTGALLQISDDCRPVEYELFSNRSAFRRAVFSPDKCRITVSDGSEFLLDVATTVDMVFQHNIVIVLEIIFFSSDDASEKIMHVFSPDSLAVKKLIVKKVADYTWATNLGFTVTFGADGRLRSLSTELSNVRGATFDASFPQVDFSDLRKRYGPSYTMPPNIRARELTLNSDVQLGATLTLPLTGDGPFQACLLLPGSGRFDRHGIGVGLDTGFHEIADFLSANGYAVLRFDVRGEGGTMLGSLFQSNIDARYADARVALRTLVQLPEVNPKRIFLIGHSLGALIAMKVAAEAAEPLRGLVLLASPGRRLDQVLLMQARQEARRLGFSAEQTARRQEKLQAAFKSASAIRGKGSVAEQFGITAQALCDLLVLEPLELLSKLRVSLLLCQGAKDIQISVRRDALRLFLAASEAGVQVQLRLFSFCDHFFKEETGTSSPLRYFVERPIYRPFLHALRQWLDDHD